MDKMRMETADLTQENIEKIAELFPQVVTEALDAAKSTPTKKVYKKVVNFEALRQVLTADALSGDEAYEFTWVGKKHAMAEIGKPIRKTLRPVIADSVDWDTTKNIYIEGDNLEALKLLHESYRGKVKMIYIDPPYNTGNDFVYRDDFAMSKGDFEESVGAYDDETGDKLFRNTESNGRYHSDWCSMIYPRLVIARNLLKQDGVIFISIDDNEVSNLKKICDEVFGAANFVECLIWKKRATPPNDKNIGRIHEFILCYAKNQEELILGLLPRDEASIERYQNPDNDPRGPWAASDLSANGKGGRMVESLVYPIVNPKDGKEYFPSEGRCWLFNREKSYAWVKEGRIAFRETTGAPFLKRYLSEVRDGLTLPTILTEMGYSSTSAAEADKLFENKGIFEYAKPTTLMKPLLKVGCPSRESIILDFFSGSATTAHAVMQLNAEDGGNRRHIMVQLPENTDEKSEAYKAGYKNICEIGKERIRRAGKKIKDEAGLAGVNLDTGFRVYRIDDTNMKDVYYSAGAYTQDLLASLESNIKGDRSDLDLLYGCIVEWGLTLDLPYKHEQIDGITVHTVNGGDLIACFADNVPESVIKTIAKRQPLRAVFRDSSFASSPAKINVHEIFKLLAPNAKVKVL